MVSFNLLKSLLVIAIGIVFADDSDKMEGKKSIEQQLYGVNKEVSFKWSSQLINDVAYVVGEIELEANKAGIKFNVDSDEIRICLEMSRHSDFTRRRSERLLFEGKV